jgi:hypothetical protein
LPDFVASGISNPQIEVLGGQRELDSTAVFQQISPYLVFGETVLFVVTPENRNNLPEVAEGVDYVLLHDNPFVKVEKLLESFPNAVFVADNTNSFRSDGYWKREFEAAGVHFHSLREKPALEVSL